MKLMKSAFRAGLKAGLVAPVAIYAPTPVYVVAAQSFSPAAAFGTVGALLAAATATAAAQNE